MRRDEFLAQPVVDEFVNHVARLLDDAPFEHAYVVHDGRLPHGHPALRTGGRLRIRTLQDAFRQSWWRGLEYDSHKPIYDELRAGVRQATADPFDPHAPELYHAALDAVLGWVAGGHGGSQYLANLAWANACGPSLVARLEAGRREMDSADPDPGLFDVDVGPRANAMLGRWYAIVCERVMVYDGSIGAALGLVVRRFCEGSGRATVPPQLAFRWAPPSGGGLQRRDPSAGDWHFERLPPQGGAAWAICQLRASWIFDAALQRSSAGWCALDDGLRRIEAALFTIGYEVPSH